MNSYERLRKRYQPAEIKLLFIAESPPPADLSLSSSRRFYQADYQTGDDRLFSYTMRALYPEAAAAKTQELEAAKEQWLQRFAADGCYMIEALRRSQPHEVTKQQRQAKLKRALPVLKRRVGELAGPRTKLILIKSNVFEVAAEPLREAGFTVLNRTLLDYPGRLTARAYQEKLRSLIRA